MNTSKLCSVIIMGGILLSTGGGMAGGNPEAQFDDGNKARVAEGAESIVLKGGNMGFVTFPHGRHQNMFTDCQPCHELFPKEPNVTDKMMTAGKLKRKDVMNMCKKCHTDLAQQGQLAGPTNCKGCHIK